MSVSDETAIIATSGLVVTVNGSPCGLATTLTTDTIEVTGSPEQEQVRLLPGLASHDILVKVDLLEQPTTNSQLVQLVGTDDPDLMTVGDLGADQDGDGDVDVTITDTTAWSPNTGSGGDTVTGEGGAGTGEPTERRMVTYGGDGGDTLIGGMAGSDHFFGGLGVDHLDGGVGGADTARYDNATDGVTVDLAAGTATGGDGDDTLVNIEYAIGSHNDVLLGDDGNNTFDGLGSCDTVDGRAGTADRVAYNYGPVEVDLRHQSASTPDCDETFSNIEGAVGSPSDDTLIGDDGPNLLTGNSGDDAIVGLDGDDTLDGWAGNDALVGAAGLDRILPGTGDDIAHGGTGVDSVEYSTVNGAVTVDLSADTTGDAAGNDALAGFENVVGSTFDDTLTGDDGPNMLSGLGGDDSLFGLGGDDQLDGGEGTDACTAGGDAGDSTAGCE